MISLDLNSIEKDNSKAEGLCENCRDMVKYYVDLFNKEKEINGKKVEYIEKIAYCSECKEEIFVSEIRDYNLKALDEAYQFLSNNWIPVDKRLPEEFVSVLVTSGSGDLHIAYYDSKQRWHLSYNGFLFVSNPIAWMPLPEAYEEKDNN